MPSATEENYLKTLYHLEAACEAVSITALSKQMQVSLPSVNSMVKRLHEKKLVSYQKYRPLRLTDEGKREALRIIRKHRLVEMFLVEKMNFGWEEVHEIAEQVEHIRAPAFFERIDELLGYPQTDPHGSPIPDKEGNIQTPTHARLTTYQPQQTIELVALADSSRDFLDYLNCKNLRLGQRLQVVSVDAFDQTMHLTFLDETETVVLSQAAAEQLYAIRVS
ncbi:MAG: metal-dependent transcriptional regulator [Bernardetiaceae bacterium]